MPADPSLARMAQQLRTEPQCPLCERPMSVRERGLAQAGLPTEYVCLDLDCLEFGVYYRRADEAETLV